MKNVQGSLSAQEGSGTIIPVFDIYDKPETVEEPDRPLAFCQDEGLDGCVVKYAIVRKYF